MGGVHRVCVALAEIEDMAPRRSIPLTALLMRMFITERAVAPVAWYDGMTVGEMCTLRDVARYNLFRCCMLRRDDTRDGKLRVGMYKLGAAPTAGS